MMDTILISRVLLFNLLLLVQSCTCIRMEHKPLSYVDIVPSKDIVVPANVQFRPVHVHKHLTSVDNLPENGGDVAESGDALYEKGDVKQSNGKLSANGDHLPAKSSTIPGNVAIDCILPAPDYIHDSFAIKMIDKFTIDACKNQPIPEVVKICVPHMPVNGTSPIRNYLIKTDKTSTMLRYMESENSATCIESIYGPAGTYRDITVREVTKNSHTPQHDCCLSINTECNKYKVTSYEVIIESIMVSDFHGRNRLFEEDALGDAMKMYPLYIWFLPDIIKGYKKMLRLPRSSVHIVQTVKNNTSAYPLQYVPGNYLPLFMPTWNQDEEHNYLFGKIVGITSDDIIIHVATVPQSPNGDSGGFFEYVIATWNAPYVTFFNAITYYLGNYTCMFYVATAILLTFRQSLTLCHTKNCTLKLALKFVNILCEIVYITFCVDLLCRHLFATCVIFHTNIYDDILRDRLRIHRGLDIPHNGIAEKCVRIFHILTMSSFWLAYSPLIHWAVTFTSQKLAKYIDSQKRLIEASDSAKISNLEELKSGTNSESKLKGYNYIAINNDPSKDDALIDLRPTDIARTIDLSLETKLKKSENVLAVSENENNSDKKLGKPKNSAQCFYTRSSCVFLMGVIVQFALMVLLKVVNIDILIGMF